MILYTTVRSTGWVLGISLYAMWKVFMLQTILKNHCYVSNILEILFRTTEANYLVCQGL